MHMIRHDDITVYARNRVRVVFYQRSDGGKVGVGADVVIGPYGRRVGWADVVIGPYGGWVGWADVVIGPYGGWVGWADVSQSVPYEGT